VRKLAGCLLVFLAFVVGAGLLAAALGYPVLPRIGEWLSVSTPVRPVDLIVALGGDRQREEKAAELARLGLASHVLFTGADVRDRDYECEGVPREKAAGLARPAYTTGEEAAAVREVMKKHGWKNVMIVTSPFHSRRALYIFRRALAGTASEVLYAPAPYDGFHLEDWWKSHLGVKCVAKEYAGLVYYWVRSRE
jgi:uncharacterized SAM-binding protein YcdF (DUF218 family)